MTDFFNQRADKVRSLSRQRIVIGNSSLAKYPEGGGLWTWLLQYMLGFYALGQDVFWFELLLSTADWQRDEARIKTFFERFEQYGLRDRCVLLFFAPGTAEIDLTTAQPLGMIEREMREICDSADLLLNMSCAFRSPLLLRFRHRVHVDGDPRHLQIGALTCREDLGFSVDLETEAAIVESTYRLMEGRTSFMISHRLSTLARADQIIALNGGQIAEIKGPHELRASEGHYQRYFESASDRNAAAAGARSV